MKFWDAFIDEIDKLASYEPWGMGGEWSTYSGQDNELDSPLLHERSEPQDVTAKNYRRDHFMDMRTKPDSGKITPGKLGKGRWNG